MANTYSALQKQIADLQKQADKLRDAERGDALKKAKELIAAFQFDARELGLAARQARAAGVTRGLTRMRSVGVPKYRDPKSGATWTGRGRAPDWIKNAKNRDTFLIEGAASVAAPVDGGPKRARRTQNTAAAERSAAKRPARKRAAAAKSAPQKKAAKQATKKSSGAPSKRRKAAPATSASEPAPAQQEMAAEA